MAIFIPQGQAQVPLVFRVDVAIDGKFPRQSAGHVISRLPPRRIAFGQRAAADGISQEIGLITAVKGTFQEGCRFAMGGLALLRALVMGIDDPAVRRNDSPDVRIALHAAFDFKGRDAGIEQVVDIIEGFQILQAEDIGLVFHDRLAIAEQRIGLTAGLGTGTAVAAAAAEETAHQALAGIGHARRAVDEDFNGNGRLGADEADFLRRQFAGQDGLSEAIGLKETDTVQVGHGHLRTAVERQIRCDFPGQSGYGQVLDDDAIDAE